MQAESSLVRPASTNGGAEKEPPTISQIDASTPTGQETAERPQDEQVCFTPLSQVAQDRT